jgi:hypothetical protein
LAVWAVLTVISAAMSTGPFSSAVTGIFVYDSNFHWDIKTVRKTSVLESIYENTRKIVGRNNIRIE